MLKERLGGKGGKNGRGGGVTEGENQKKGGIMWVGYWVTTLSGKLKEDWEGASNGRLEQRERRDALLSVGMQKGK